MIKFSELLDERWVVRLRVGGRNGWRRRVGKGDGGRGSRAGDGYGEGRQEGVRLGGYGEGFGGSFLVGCSELARLSVDGGNAMFEAWTGGVAGCGVSGVWGCCSGAESCSARRGFLEILGGGGGDALDKWAWGGGGGSNQRVHDWEEGEEKFAITWEGDRSNKVEAQTKYSSRTLNT